MPGRNSRLHGAQSLGANQLAGGYQIEEELRRLQLVIIVDGEIELQIDWLHCHVGVRQCAGSIHCSFSSDPLRRAREMSSQDVRTKQTRDPRVKREGKQRATLCTFYRDSVRSGKLQGMRVRNCGWGMQKSPVCG